MVAARILVFERSSRWVVPVRWAFRDTEFRVEAAPDWDAIHLAMAGGRPVVLMIELSVEAVGSGGLETFLHRFPDACWIALGASEDEGSSWLARELGAIHALTSTRYLAPTVRLVSRYLERAAGRNRDFVERVWADLPFA